MSRLSDERVLSLYQAFDPARAYPDWHPKHRDALLRLGGIADEDLRKPGVQEQLWRATGITTLGSGEAVTVAGAYTDPEVVDEIVKVRTAEWPADVGRRANAMQDAFDRIIQLVSPKYNTARPQAKLTRLFLALRPHDLNTCCSWPSQKAVATFLLGRRSPGPIACGVLARERLRSILGQETDSEEDIRRSMFCWWLFANRETIAADEVPVAESESIDEEALVLWPATKLRHGVPAVGGYVETFRAVVRAAQEGASTEDIVSTLQGDLENVSEKSCRMVFNRVRRLGFLANRDGLWHPSDDGEELVEADPPDILVRRLLVQTFGLAHVLRLLRASGTRTKLEICNELRGLHPTWTANFMPSSILAWSRSLGLVRRDDKQRHSLTDYGADWEQRLPSDLPVPAVDVEQLEDDDDDSDGPAGEWPKAAAVEASFRKDEALSGFVFAPDQIRALHTAWHCHPTKRFVILSGLSGTGKTALLVHYARVYLEALDLDVGRHRVVVPVSPDWRDPTGLIGYFNALHADPTFQAEPALRLILAAVRNPSAPYFLILDEMNLARVERYFAPFLSAMETGEALLLHANEEPVNGVPPRVPWPTNLFIGGTVNMDETTHPFSDKVLDRAFTLEFWDVDLDDYFDRRAAANGVARRPGVEELLHAAHKVLYKIRRHFGYRTAGEVLGFVDTALDGRQESSDEEAAVVDQAVFSKVLPRLRGEDSQELRTALDALEEVFATRELRACQRKLVEMRDLLTTTGVTRFWT